MLLVPGLALCYGLLTGTPRSTIATMRAIALPIGLLGPDWILRIPQRSHRRALQRGLADALDLLVVCSEAGMGLESGSDQVAKEMRLSNPAMANALAVLPRELKVLPDRRQALTNFGTRSGVHGIRRMSTS